jgi:hypothetical protein
MGSLQSSILKLGITTIFLDRLVLSLNRAWKVLGETLGAVRVSEHAVQFTRLAEITGMGVVKLQAFSFAAKRLGMELTDVSDLFQTLNERVNDLRSGQEKGVTEDFGRFGLSAETFAGASDPLEMLKAFSEATSKMSATDRMSIAEKVFGGDIARKAGLFLAQGAGSITEAMAGAMASGAVLSKQQIKHAASFRLAQEHFGEVMEGLSNHVASVFIPALTHVTEIMGGLVKKVSLLTRSQVIVWSDYLLQKVSDITSKLLDMVFVIDTKIMPFEEFIVRLGRGFTGLAAAFGALVLGRFAAQMWGLGKVLLLMAIAVEDIYGYISGEQSLSEKLLQSSPMVKDYIWLIKLVTGTFLGAMTDIKKLALQLLSYTFIWKGVIPGFMAAGGLIMGAFRLVVGYVRLMSAEFERWFILLNGVWQIYKSIYRLFTGGDAGAAFSQGVSQIRGAINPLDYYGVMGATPNWEQGDLMKQYAGEDLTGVISSAQSLTNVTNNVSFSNQTSGVENPDLHGRTRALDDYSYADYLLETTQ